MWMDCYVRKLFIECDVKTTAEHARGKADPDGSQLILGKHGNHSDPEIPPGTKDSNRNRKILPESVRFHQDFSLMKSTKH